MANCPHCNGTGRVEVYKGTRGGLSSPDEIDDTTLCPYCDGDGQIGDDDLG